jgi:hypothetical protein
LPSVPKATIYLRDKFSVLPGQWRNFLCGKENLLRAGHGAWELVAAAGGAPLFIDENLPEPSTAMMNVWRVDDWDTLYKDMYRFTDTTWYAKLQQTIRREQQDLLVGLKVGSGTTPRFGWSNSKRTARPNHVYLYEEVRLKSAPSGGRRQLHEQAHANLSSESRTRLPLSAHSYLRDLNWFADTMEARGWRWVWGAIQVTGTPGAICLLWEVRDFATLEKDLERIREESSTPVTVMRGGREVVESRQGRYARMLEQVDSLVRYPLYPIATEQLDNMIAGAIEEKDPEILETGIVCPTQDLVPIQK